MVGPRVRGRALGAGWGWVGLWGRPCGEVGDLESQIGHCGVSHSLTYLRSHTGTPHSPRLQPKPSLGGHKLQMWSRVSPWFELVSLL